MVPPGSRPIMACSCVGSSRRGSLGAGAACPAVGVPGFGFWLGGFWGVCRSVGWLSVVQCEAAVTRLWGYCEVGCMARGRS